MHVSITGFRAHSVFAMPRFWWHAIRSMHQARRAEGVLHVEAGTVDGIQHTLTAWRDRAAMLDFLRSGAHLQAMQAFPQIGSGFGFGFSAEQMPAFRAVHGLWLAEAERRAAQPARQKSA